MSDIAQQSGPWKLEFCISKGGPKRWIEVCMLPFERQIAWLNNLCFQYFLGKAQTKSLLVIGDHKFESYYCD